MEPKRPSQVNRRQFIQTTTAVAVAPMIVPRHVLARSQGTPPSDVVTLGSIGVGRMGGGHLSGFLRMPDVRIVAISDVRQDRRQQAKASVDKRYGDTTSRTYADFRELLAQPDIDAVVIATGENWHPLVSIEAARRGKHIYCEKPLSTSLAEGLVVREAVNKYGVVFQWGTQQRSSRDYRQAAELVRNGYIGDVRTVIIRSTGGSHTKRILETISDPPAGFDYDAWLGPAPYAPYSPERVSLEGWIFIRDYGLGHMGGAWGIHDIDATQFFLDTDNTAPVEVEGRARYYDDIRDTPYAWVVEHKYANGITVIHADRESALSRAPQFKFGNQATVVNGTKGWIWVSRQGIRTEPESLATQVIGPNEKHVILSDDHKRNFIDAIRKRAQPISPINAAVHAETINQQADIAMRLQRKLRWDPTAERFIDDEQANRMLSRPIRAPWTYTV
jgi:predicted dehydrogenase